MRFVQSSGHAGERNLRAAQRLLCASCLRYPRSRCYACTCREAFSNARQLRWPALLTLAACMLSVMLVFAGPLSSGAFPRLRQQSKITPGVKSEKEAPPEQERTQVCPGEGPLTLVSHAGFLPEEPAGVQALAGWLQSLALPQGNAGVASISFVLDASMSKTDMPDQTEQGIPIRYARASTLPVQVEALLSAGRAPTAAVLLLDPMAPIGPTAVADLYREWRTSPCSLVGPMPRGLRSPSQPHLGMAMVGAQQLHPLQSSAELPRCREDAIDSLLPLANQQLVRGVTWQEPLLQAFAASPSTVQTGNIATTWSFKGQRECQADELLGSVFSPKRTLAGILPEGMLGMRVFVYDMPEEFTLSYLKEASTSRGRLNKCSSSFYASEQRVHEYLLDSPWRVEDPAQADLFYVPVYVACAIKLGLRVQLQQEGTRKPGFAPDLQGLQDIMKRVLTYIRREHPFWDMSGGRDHVWAFSQGAGAAVFGDELWEEVQHSIVLTTNGQLSEATYRMDHDIVIPSFMNRVPGVLHHNPLNSSLSRPLAVYWGGSLMEDKRYSRGVRHALVDAFDGGEFPNDVLVEVSKGKWRDTFTKQLESKFCLALEGWWTWTPRPFESLLQGCIPALVSDDIVLPFQRFLEWDSFSVKLSPIRGIHAIVSALRSVPQQQVRHLQAGVARSWAAFHWTAPFGQAGAYLAAELILKAHTLRSLRRFEVGAQWLPLRLTREWGVAEAVDSRQVSLSVLSGSTKYIRSRTESCSALISVQRSACFLKGRSHCFKESLSAALWEACPHLDYGYSSRAAAVRQGGHLRDPAASTPIVQKIPSATRDAHFTITPYLFVGSKVYKVGWSTSILPISIVTQLSVDRLNHLLDLAEFWKGPVSAAVFLQGASWSFQRLLEVVQQRPDAAKWLALHVVVPLGAGIDAHNVYPVNLLRAVAQQLATADLVFALDADVMPSASMAEFSRVLLRVKQAEGQGELGTPSRGSMENCKAGQARNSNGFNIGNHNPVSKTDSCAGLRAYVVPSFEEGGGTVPSPLPSSAKGVYDEIMKGGMSPMHAYYPRAYFPVDFVRWLSDSDPTGYSVPYSPHFEPYVIVSKFAPLPNASFIQRGLNKAQWAYHLYAAGYSFTVLPGLYSMDIPTGFLGQRPRMVGVEGLWEELSASFSEDFGVATYNTSMISRMSPYLRGGPKKQPWWKVVIDGGTSKKGGSVVAKAIAGGASADLKQHMSSGVLSVFIRACASKAALSSLVTHYCNIPLVKDVSLGPACEGQWDLPDGSSFSCGPKVILRGMKDAGPNGTPAHELLHDMPQPSYVRGSFPPNAAQC